MVRRLALVLATVAFGLAALAFLGTGPTAHHAGRSLRCDSVVVRLQTGPQLPDRREDVPLLRACEGREGGYAAGALLAAVLCLTFGLGARTNGPKGLCAIS
jgi:hypothetical protein